MYIRFVTHVMLLSFFYFLGFWVWLNVGSSESEVLHNIFSDTYALVPLISVFVGLLSALEWHTFHNNVGKSLILFSVALFFQFLGHISFTAYFLISGVANPIATFGDLFYLVALILNIFGIVFLYKGMGISTLSKYRHLELSFLLLMPLLLIVFGYSSYIPVLNLAVLIPYLYVTLSFTAGFLMLKLMFFGRHILDGRFLTDFIVFSLAFALQFVAEFIYMSETSSNSWYAGGLSDFIYLLSYACLGLGLSRIGIKFYKPNTEPVIVLFSYKSVLDNIMTFNFVRKSDKLRRFYRL